MGSSDDWWGVVVLIGHLESVESSDSLTGHPNGPPAAVQPRAGPGSSKSLCDGARRQATTLWSHGSVSIVSPRIPCLSRKKDKIGATGPDVARRPCARRDFGMHRRGTAVGRCLCTLRPMLVSYVVRLHTDRVGDEDFTGQVEAVASG